MGLKQREHFRAVVWPRGVLDGPEGKNYRYLVSGMLVTDRPIEGLEGFNETILDDSSPGLAAVLGLMPKRENDRGYPIGTVDSFLCGMVDFKSRLR